MRALSIEVQQGRCPPCRVQQSRLMASIDGARLELRHLEELGKLSFRFVCCREHYWQSRAHWHGSSISTCTRVHHPATALALIIQSAGLAPLSLHLYTVHHPATALALQSRVRAWPPYLSICILYTAPQLPLPYHPECGLGSSISPDPVFV